MRAVARLLKGEHRLRGHAERGVPRDVRVRPLAMAAAGGGGGDGGGAARHQAAGGGRTRVGRGRPLRQRGASRRRPGRARFGRRLARLRLPRRRGHGALHGRDAHDTRLPAAWRMAASVASPAALRFIVILREPAERAASHFGMLRKLALRGEAWAMLYVRNVTQRADERLLSEASAFERCAARRLTGGRHTPAAGANDGGGGGAAAAGGVARVRRRRVQHACVVGQSICEPQLRAWLNTFSAPQFLVLTLDDFSSQPSASLARVAGFLGVGAFPRLVTNGSGSGTSPREGKEAEHERDRADALASAPLFAHERACGAAAEARAAGGGEHSGRGQGATSSSWSEAEQGEERSVPLLYEPYDPLDASLDSSSGLALFQSSAFSCGRPAQSLVAPISTSVIRLHAWSPYQSVRVPSVTLDVYPPRGALSRRTAS